MHTPTGRYADHAYEFAPKFDCVCTKNELDPVGATNILRGLAAKIKFVDRVARNGENVNKKLSDFDADYVALQLM